MSKEWMIALVTAGLAGAGAVAWEFIHRVDKLEDHDTNAQKYIYRLEDVEDTVDDHEERIRYVERNYMKKKP